MLEVMIVNGKRHLINTQSTSVDNTCEYILSKYPQDAAIEFDSVKDSDLNNNLTFKN